MSNNVALSKLIEYLRIKTAHPEPDYERYGQLLNLLKDHNTKHIVDGAIKFLKQYAQEIGFDSYKEIEVAPNRIVCLMSYYGTAPDKPSILLNSHTDVVPVDQKYWKCDAFEGKIFENGDIYGRGVQDMKSVGIQHLEIIRRLKSNNIRPERTIHLSFVPDEEIGGLTGMLPFLESKDFTDLNVGLAFDEGQVSSEEEFCVYYGERLAWWLTVTCTGNTGHGSRFIEKTAAEKLQRLINLILAYREEQKAKVKDGCSCLKLGDVTSVNLTELSGGIARNTVPSEFKATFDFRITPKTTIKEFEELFESWIREAEGSDTDSGKISYIFENKSDQFALTSIDENQNKWWKSFKKSCSELNIKTNEEIFPAATDSRFLREKGIPAFGFTPINKTPILLHDHNEFINERNFLNGIDILYKIVLDTANLA